MHFPLNRLLASICDLNRINRIWISDFRFFNFFKYFQFFLTCYVIVSIKNQTKSQNWQKYLPFCNIKLIFHFKWIQFFLNIFKIFQNEKKYISFCNIKLIFHSEWIQFFLNNFLNFFQKLSEFLKIFIFCMISLKKCFFLG